MNQGKKFYKIQFLVKKKICRSENIQEDCSTVKKCWKEQQEHYRTFVASHISLNIFTNDMITKHFANLLLIVNA